MGGELMKSRHKFEGLGNVCVVGGWTENHALRVAIFGIPFEKSYDMRKCFAKFHNAKML